MAGEDGNWRPEEGKGEIGRTKKKRYGNDPDNAKPPRWRGGSHRAGRERAITARTGKTSLTARCSHIVQRMKNGDEIIRRADWKGSSEYANALNFTFICSSAPAISQTLFSPFFSSHRLPTHPPLPLRRPSSLHIKHTAGTLTVY